jgi:hypothetical protein
MNLKHHKTLTAEKWGGFPLSRQLLMIANEMNRAGNWIVKNDSAEVKQCYERALELTFLTIGTLKARSKLRELCRFKEMLARLYGNANPDKKENAALMNCLISLDKDSFAMVPGKS